MSRKPIPAPRADSRAQKTGSQPAPAGDRKVHFLLTDAYLVAANTGKPLTRMGLEAMCLIGRDANDLMRQSRLRRGNPPASMDQLEVIRERWLQAFETNPDRISHNAAREAELAAGLADDIFFQLMQNANDACAATLRRGRAMLLGKNGRGFRSVLSLTDQPRFHSGDVSFAFDPVRAYKAVKKRLGRKTPQDIPVLRLPFACAAKDEPPAIRALIEQYETAIVMPFRSLKACERCRAGWDKAVEDMSLLKRLPAINLMTWERDDATAQYKRTIRDNVDRTVRLANPTRKPASVGLVVGDKTHRSTPAAKRGPTITMNAPAQSQSVAKQPTASGVTLSAEVVRHVDAKSAKKPNGSAGPSAKKATSAKTRKSTNGTSASKSKPQITKSARASVSEKAKTSAARKPAANKPAAKTAAGKKPAAKKPAQKAAATHTKTKTAKAPAARKPAARKPASKRRATQSKSAGNAKTAGARKPATAAKKPAQKSAAAKTKTSTSKSAAARKPAAKKPAAKKPAAQKKPASKTKPAGTRKPATRKATAKPRNARAKAAKTSSKTKASAKKT